LNALITHPVFKGISNKKKKKITYFVFVSSYGTHLCAWPAPCPAISPAAPFAHYDQLVAQALSTTDSVFAKIESAGEKNLATAKQTTSGK